MGMPRSVHSPSSDTAHNVAHAAREASELSQRRKQFSVLNIKGREVEIWLHDDKGMIPPISQAENAAFFRRGLSFYDWQPASSEMEPDGEGKPATGVILKLRLVPIEQLRRGTSQPSSGRGQR